MGIWQHTHTATTTEVSPDLGELAEILDDVSVEMIHYAIIEAVEPFKLHPTSMSYIYQLMSLTYRICFISLPIPVTGPEGPSKFLVLSWELAFYEISVASQKSVMLAFLEWCTFFYSTAFFPLFCYERPYESRVGY